MRNTLNINTYFDDLVRDLNRFAVGYEPTLRMLDNVRHNANNTGGFPPYDLEKLSDTQYQLSMAVAGYAADDLNITEHEGTLTVEGKVQAEDDRTYLHKGIAGRSFRRTFYLDQHVYTVGSSLENGILTIQFEKRVPEELKPRRIEIGAKPKEILLG